MGEVTDMVLDGFLCEGCGVAMVGPPGAGLLPEAPGHPVRCEHCDEDGENTMPNKSHPVELPEWMGEMELVQAVSRRIEDGVTRESAAELVAEMACAAGLVLALWPGDLRDKALDRIREAAQELGGSVGLIEQALVMRADTKDSDDA